MAFREHTRFACLWPAPPAALPGAAGETFLSVVTHGAPHETAHARVPPTASPAEFWEAVLRAAGGPVHAVLVPAQLDLRRTPAADAPPGTQVLALFASQKELDALLDLRGLTVAPPAVPDPAAVRTARLVAAVLGVERPLLEARLADAARRRAAFDSRKRKPDPLPEPPRPRAATPPPPAPIAPGCTVSAAQGLAALVAMLAGGSVFGGRHTPLQLFARFFHFLGRYDSAEKRRHLADVLRVYGAALPEGPPRDTFAAFMQHVTSPGAGRMTLMGRCADRDGGICLATVADMVDRVEAVHHALP